LGATRMDTNKCRPSSDALELEPCTEMTLWWA
jgi:hypothetical protein